MNRKLRVVINKQKDEEFGSLSGAKNHLKQYRDGAIFDVAGDKPILLYYRSNFRTYDALAHERFTL